MERYFGTQTVEPGIYFEARKLVFRSFDERTTLPGTPQTAYRKVPALVLLLAAPVLGGLYAIYLPLVGMLMLLAAIGEKGGALARDAGRALVRVTAPAWQPARAFLGRAKKADREPAPGEQPDAWAAKARREAEKKPEDTVK